MVPVRDRVATALETEGIVSDVTAAILAAVVSRGITAGNDGPEQLVRLFVSKLGTGILVGLVVVGVLWYLLKHADLSPRNARLLVLAGALVARHDGTARGGGRRRGRTAGVVLGNTDIPYKTDISESRVT